MPRQHTRHSRIVYVFPDDFPQRLERFKEESGLSWAEIARRLGTYPTPWTVGGIRECVPTSRHLMALLDLAEDLGLLHLFTAWIVPDGTPVQASAEAGTGGAEMQKERHTRKRRRKDVPFAMQGEWTVPLLPAFPAQALAHGNPTPADKRTLH